MKILLDTHSLIWFFSGHQSLSHTARQLMENIEHQKFISLATVWEMAIKQSKQKLTLNKTLANYIQAKIKLEDFNLLTINLRHLETVSRLDFYHKDPFDRLIIAQGIT